MQTKFNIGDTVCIADTNKKTIHQNQEIDKIIINENGNIYYSSRYLSVSAKEENVFATLNEAKSYIISELKNQLNERVKTVMELEEI